MVGESRIELPPELPPMASALVGYMGYDTVRLMERLPEENPDVRALNGWRRKIFGADALELRAGRLALTGDGPGVAEVRVSPHHES